MNKRGQFFLFAALVISTILFSLAIVSNSAINVQEDYSPANIADEMVFEVSEMLNHNFYLGKEDVAESNLLKISDSFALNYKNLDMIIIYGQSDSEIKARHYKLGTPEDYTPKVRVSGAAIKAEYEGQTYEFIKHNGYNFHVIVKKEGQYGKFISAK